MKRALILSLLAAAVLVAFAESSQAQLLRMRRSSSPEPMVVQDAGVVSTEPMMMRRGLLSRRMPMRTAYYGAPIATEKQALIRVMAPTPDAKVMLNGTPMTQTGMSRMYVSPDMAAGKTYSYTVKCTWMEGGKEVVKEKMVDVMPAQDVVVSFVEPMLMRTRMTPMSDTGVMPARYETRTGLLRRPMYMEMGTVVRSANGEMVIMPVNSTTEMTQRMLPDTMIYVDGKPGTMADIKPGMSVEVMTTRRGVVTQVEAMTPVKK